MESVQPQKLSFVRLPFRQRIGTNRWVSVAMRSFGCIAHQLYRLIARRRPSLDARRGKELGAIEPLKGVGSPSSGCPPAAANGGVRVTMMRLARGLCPCTCFIDRLYHSVVAGEHRRGGDVLFREQPEEFCGLEYRHRELQEER